MELYKRVVTSERTNHSSTTGKVSVQNFTVIRLQERKGVEDENKAKEV